MPSTLNPSLSSNTFLLTNVSLPSNRLHLPTSTHGPTTTTSPPDSTQLWTFQRVANGFRIQSVDEPPRKLALSKTQVAWNARMLTAVEEEHEETVWCVESEEWQGETVYRIHSVVEGRYKLAIGNNGAFLPRWLIAFGGGEHEDQLWRLEPRFKAHVKQVVVWEGVDGGRADVKRGIEVLDHAGHFRQRAGWVNAAVMALSLGCEEVGVERGEELELRKCIEEMRENGEKNIEHVEVEIEGGGKMMQWMAVVESVIKEDGFVVFGNWDVVTA